MIQISDHPVHIGGRVSTVGRNQQGDKVGSHIGAQWVHTTHFASRFSLQSLKNSSCKLNTFKPKIKTFLSDLERLGSLPPVSWLQEEMLASVYIGPQELCKVHCNERKFSLEDSTGTDSHTHFRCITVLYVMNDKFVACRESTPPIMLGSEGNTAGPSDCHQTSVSQDGGGANDHL